jgi:hypothetical protein
MTATADRTLQEALNSGNPAEQATALQRLKLGDTMEQIDETITIAAGTTLNLETQSTAKKAALMVQSVRVVTGTATGLRQIGDAGATPSTTIVALSADGKTLTFEANVTVVRVVWIPKTLDPDTKYATT